MTSESVAINSRRASGSTRPPDYVVVVSASDWVKEHFPAAGANLWDALPTGEDRHRDPSPAWKPNHDPDPEVTAMTLTINDTTMTSDQTAHTARHAPGGTAGKFLAARPAPGPQHRHHRDDPGRHRRRT